MSPSRSEKISSDSRFSDKAIDLALHAVVAAELALVLMIFHVFDLERSSGLLSLTTLIVGAFIVHAVLPMTYRLPFFVATSLAAFWIVLGPIALLIFAGCLVFIGICHLPIRLLLRSIVLAILGAALGFLMLKGMPGLPPKLLVKGLPVFASLFMFRIIIYLYELRHERGVVSPWMRVSYFFLFPNACFTLFPVVDFQALRRTYYDRPHLEIYQRGVKLILRGITHLLLYRLVYYYWTPTPLGVNGVASVAKFLASSWLLFLHVSGVFHVVIGTLCLFGFNLPDANRLYFLAETPNEIWRRANIYWRDFMMKVFYLPAYKAAQKRKLSMMTSIVGATIVVFVATWLLHSYQWFWLLGRFTLSRNDAEFWSLFAALVIANTVFDLKRGPKPRRAAAEKWSVGKGSMYVLRVMGTFTMMSVMWSWWNTADTDKWLYIVSTARNSRPIVFAMFTALVGAVFVAGIIANYFASRGWTLGIGSATVSFERSVVVTLAGASLLLAVGSPVVRERLGSGGARFVKSLQSEHLNERDASIEFRSYYEAIMTTDQLSGGFSPTIGTTDDLPINATPIVRHTRDALSYVFLPSRRIVNRGVVVATNSWGIRDKEYSLSKPAGTYRIALLGGSVSMGSGVKQSEVFETLTEARLNSEQPSTKFSHYEILNFSIGGHGLVQYVTMLEQQALSFHPDAVILATLGAERFRTKDLLVGMIMDGTPLPPGIVEIVKRAGLTRSSPAYVISKTLDTAPVPDEIRRWAYNRIAEVCRKRGIVPVWAYLPAAKDAEDPATYQLMFTDATNAGMVTLDNRQAFLTATHDTVYRIGDVNHPNAKGHQLLADELYRQILQHADQLGLSPLARSPK